MDLFKIVLLFMTILWVLFSFVFAPGDVQKGRTLFNDLNLAGARAGKSCGSCHPGGKGLEGSSRKKEFHRMGKIRGGIEDAINFCVVHAMNGVEIDLRSEEMSDIIAYIRSLSR